MLQQLTGCTGDNCPKAKECKLYYENLKNEYPNNLFLLESWATFGSTTMWANSETGESGCRDEWYCGPNGNYKMFQQYSKPLAELTLGEIKQICSDHLKDNKYKYCGGCRLYRFCNEQISARYPADWKLENEEK